MVEVVNESSGSPVGAAVVPSTGAPNIPKGAALSGEAITASIAAFSAFTAQLQSFGAQFETIAQALVAVSANITDKAEDSLKGKASGGGKTSSDSDDPKGEKAGNFKELTDNLETSLSSATSNILEDFKKLGVNIKSIFKSVGDAVQKALSNTLKGLMNQALGVLKDIVIKALGLAGGGRVQGGEATLVGERGPELIVTDRPSTVMNAADTARALTQQPNQLRGGSLPAPETKVIINNHSGQPAQTNRRRGSDGSDIIDVIVGRVAENMARGGEVADAASLRFGLNPVGT